MQVSNIRVTSTNDVCRLGADILFDTHWVWGDDPFQLWYEFPQDYADFISAENADPFIPALLSSAMFLGEPLVIAADAAVSQQLFSAIPRIQDIYHCWDSRHSRIEVDAAVRATGIPAETVERSALFYSLGVDSSYTLSKDLARGLSGKELPQLVMVEGFDVYLWERHRFPPMHKAAVELAGQLGTRVVTVTTNLREFSDRVTDWVHFFHGPALASTVLALGTYFSRAKIAASQTYQYLTPRGAHPLLDPLWNTESTRFEHDGLEANRLGKAKAISRFPALLKNLRVCATSELTEAYNCGRCEKCIRTMLYLHIAGALELCETLPHSIEPENIDTLRLENDVAAYQLENLIPLLGTSKLDAEIATSLRERVIDYRTRSELEVSQPGIV